MKTVRFTAHPDGYKCDHSGDQSGEYVSADLARQLLDALTDLFESLDNCKDQWPSRLQAEELLKRVNEE